VSCAIVAFEVNIFFRGVVIRRWQPVKLVKLTVAMVIFCVYRESERANLELLLLSNHVSVHNEQKRGVVITDEMVGKLIKRCVTVIM